MGNTCKSAKTEPTIRTVAALAAPIEPKPASEEIPITTLVSHSPHGSAILKRNDEVWDTFMLSNAFHSLFRRAGNSPHRVGQIQLIKFVLFFLL